MDKATHIFNSLKSNEIVKMLELISEDDEIDVDSIYKELKKQAEKRYRIDLPLIGTMTFTTTDVDKLYHSIQRY